MEDDKLRKMFYLWILAGALALIAFGISYFRSAETNFLLLLMAVVFFAMAIISRRKRPSGR
jgi:hypothetical protein